MGGSGKAWLQCVLQQRVRHKAAGHIGALRPVNDDRVIGYPAVVVVVLLFAVAILQPDDVWDMDAGVEKLFKDLGVCVTISQFER